MARRGWYRARMEGRTPDGVGRGEDRFDALPWDKALDLFAAEIDRVRRNHGNDAIFAGSYGWTSAGRFHHAPTQLKRLLNLIGGFTGHVDTYSLAAGPVILRHVLGSDDACYGRANTLETLVVFDAMSPRTAQNEAGGTAAHHLEGYLRRMVARGVHVVLVSPCRDDLPDWVPAQWCPIRPNTDTALMLALAQEIIRAGRHDAAFLSRCTNGHGEWLDYLAGRSDGQEKTADWAARITGLPAGAIRALTARLPQTRSHIVATWSLQRAPHGEQPYWAAIGLAAVIGQIGLARRRCRLRIWLGRGYRRALFGHGLSRCFRIAQTRESLHPRRPDLGSSAEPGGGIRL